ncbi:hypothetical protein [Enterococcus faecium]
MSLFRRGYFFVPSDKSICHWDFLCLFGF